MARAHDLVFRRISSIGSHASCFATALASVVCPTGAPRHPKGSKGGRRNTSDQEHPSPYIPHGVYSFKDRDSRSQHISQNHAPGCFGLQRGVAEAVGHAGQAFFVNLVGPVMKDGLNSISNM